MTNQELIQELKTEMKRNQEISDLKKELREKEKAEMIKDWPTIERKFTYRNVPNFSNKYL